jgi:hypothetical protein
MAAANAPIAMREALTVTPPPPPSPLLQYRSPSTYPPTDRSLLACPPQLTSLGIAPQFVTFTHVTMESEKYICVRETSPQNSVVIIDMAMPMQPLRRPITADSALMNPNARILALKGSDLLLLALYLPPVAPRSSPFGSLHCTWSHSHHALPTCCCHPWDCACPSQSSC